MNLIDAIKSGRPFRRKGVHSVYMKGVDSDELRQNESCEALFLRSVPDERISLMEVDILADDWEVQEATVTISASQFWEVWAEAMKYAEAANNVMQRGASPQEFAKELAQKLGLEAK